MLQAGLVVRLQIIEQVRTAEDGLIERNCMILQYHVFLLVKAFYSQHSKCGSALFASPYVNVT